MALSPYVTGLKSIIAAALVETRDQAVTDISAAETVATDAITTARDDALADVSAEGAVQVGLATAQATAAAGYAALAYPATQRDELEFDAAQRVKAGEVRPATWTPTRSISTAGNSLAAGTAANTTLHAAITAIKTGAPTITFDFDVGGGTNMAQALTALTAATAGQKARDWIIVDPVLGEKAQNNYDFCTSGETITNYESIVALQTGGAETVILVTAPADNYVSRGDPYMQADFVQFRKDIQTKSYAANFIDLRRHMIDWYGGRDGIDRTLREWDERPLQLPRPAPPMRLTVWTATRSASRVLQLICSRADPPIPIRSGPFGGCGTSTMCDWCEAANGPGLPLLGFDPVVLA